MLIDMDKINNINKKYGFKIKQLKDDTCYIDSSHDEWLIKVTREDRGIILYHKNMKYDRDNYHTQHTFYDYERAIHSIYTHKDKYKYKHDKVFRMKELFHQLSL